MTPAEILDACEHGCNVGLGLRRCPCRPCADRAIAAAVAEEREACAKIAAGMEDAVADGEAASACAGIALLIRERGVSNG